MAPASNIPNYSGLLGFVFTIAVAIIVFFKWNIGIAATQESIS